MQTNGLTPPSARQTYTNSSGKPESTNLVSRVRLILPILGSVLVLDQLAKFAARRLLRASAPHSYLGDFFRLEYAENKGAFLGLGSTLPDVVRFWWFIVVIGLIVTCLLAYTLCTKDLDRGEVTALTFVSGSALSNWVDRIFFHGSVTDFMNVGIGTLRTGIFNIADMFQIAGVALLLLNLLLDSTDHESK